jgi:hypothetical protein
MHEIPKSEVHTSPLLVLLMDNVKDLKQYKCGVALNGVIYISSLMKISYSV